MKSHSFPLARAARALTLVALALILSLVSPGAVSAAKRLTVITTTQDLASIAAEIGGDRVSVEALAKGYQDPHFVDAKPSYLVKLRKADLFVQVGRDLEVGWVPGLLRNARNTRILPGGSGFVDASNGVSVLEQGARVGREQGDVHPLGNPHYWLDPENGKVIAKNIRNGLSLVSPADRAYFDSRYEAFEKRLEESVARWKGEAKRMGLEGSQIVTYHRSWSYFAKAFGCEVIGNVEPRPGVPPPPKHIQSLTELMKAGKVPLLVVEPYFDPKLPSRIAQQTGATLVVLPPSVGAVKEATDYLKLFDVQLAMLRKALSERGRS
jgi:zinc/manganese transport system substrate-binding protein